MDEESKTPATSSPSSEQKPQEQAGPTTPPADAKPAEQKPLAPSESKSEAPTEAKSESAEKPTETPPKLGDAAVPPKRSSAGLWLLVVVAAIVCGAGGFVLGQGSSQASDKSGQQDPTPTVAQNKKQVETKITGRVKTDAHGLDYLVLDVSEFANVKAKNHEIRYILNPQANTEYAYSFEELKPNVAYTVMMQGCVEKDQKSTCVLSKKVLSCSGRIPGGAVQQCLINGDGQADFFLDKSLVNEVVNPTGTPIPTPEPPTATPTP